MGKIMTKVLGGLAVGLLTIGAAAAVPVVSAAMSSFLAEAGAAAQRVAGSPFFAYEAAGGRAGYGRTITIAQDGSISDDVTYAAAVFAGQQYSKQGSLTADQMNDL